MTAKVVPLDTLLACKAIALLPELSASERRVACAIVEHFSRADGECEPTVERLVWLLDIDRSTVLRAIGSLHERGLILRTRHGGRFQRNRYEPNWNLLREHHEAWNARIHARRHRRPDVAGAPPKGSQERHLGGGTAATQTCLSNLLNEPAVAPAAKPTNARNRGKAASGLAGKGKTPSPAFAQGQSQGSRQAAEAAATRRWNDDLRNRLRDRLDVYALAIELATTEMQDAATAAEMRRHGAGVELILDRVAKGRAGPVTPPLLGVVSNPDDKPVRPAKTRPDNP